MFKNILFACTIVLLVILSCTPIVREYAWNITRNGNHGLSQATEQLLAKIDAPLTLTVHSADMQLLRACEAFLQRYKQKSPQITISLQNNILNPAQATKLKLTTEHNIIVAYKNTQRAIDLDLNDLSEQQISNLIQQTINTADQWLVFLTGHQEIDPLDTSAMGISEFANNFAKQGMSIATLNLSQQQFIPQNTALLIVANPQQDLLPIEKDLLHQYLTNGGKLVWFTEPDSPSTEFLVEEFGLKPSKGVAIDPASLQLGSPHPAIKILTNYPNHPITNEIKAATILPWSANLRVLYEANGWDQSVFLTTNPDTWTYVGSATQELKTLRQFKEQQGPLNLGFALYRANDDHEQRALVIADSSFILNKYLPLYANAQLATSIAVWTQNDTQVFIVNPPPSKEFSYNPSKLDRFMYQYFFTILLPLVFIGLGWRRGKLKTG